MQQFIGEKLEAVLKFFDENKLNYVVYDNNHSVNGDTKLVTNIKKENNLYKITTSNFLFDVKNKQ